MRFVTRTRVFVCGFVALVGAVLFLAAGPAAPAPNADPPAPVTGTAFHPLTPTRVLNTRNGQGVPGGQAAKLGPGGTVTIDIRDLVPDLAYDGSSVVLNVTVTDVTATTYVAAWDGRT